MAFIDDMQSRDLAILQALDGREVTYTPNGGSPRTVSAMFQQFSETTQGETVDVIAAQPILSIRSIDIAEIAIGDQFTVNSKNYEVTVIQPDSEGMTEIILEIL